MSIYIKNAKVPECCAECPFETLFSNDIHYCTAEEIPTEIPTAYYWECRPLFCPMSEVTEPHGRLVDADMAYQETMKYGNHFRKSVLKTIDNLPTIIERSEPLEG